MNDGLHGVFQLGAQGLSDAERSWLACGAAGAQRTRWSDQTAGFWFSDGAPLPGDTGYVAQQGLVTGFLGDLDHRCALAARLALASDSAAAQLVWTALQRGGERGLDDVHGQWTFWCWEVRTRVLTVAVSRNLRDPLYLASGGSCVALSSSIRHLQGLPWLSRDVDAQGLLLAMGRAPLRTSGDGRTWQHDVMALLPGSLHRLRLGEHTRSTWAAPLPPEQWQGDFTAAVGEMERRARDAVRLRIRRHRTIAVMLSGGMDSSVLAWLAASVLRPDQRLIAVSSVASSASGLADERRWIALVARTLGIDVHYVSPAADTDVYRPSSAHFTQLESPLPGPRHYLYEQLFMAARAAGADAVLDGCYGEHSLTRAAHRQVARAYWKQVAAHLLLHARRACARCRDPGIAELFHVQLSAKARSMLRGPMPRHLPAPGMAPHSRPWRLPMGLPQGYAKAAAHTENTCVAGLRRLMPFRAQELASLSAALPGTMVERDGQSRAIVRAILRQGFPAELYLRPDKQAFSPEHPLLLQRGAAAELARIDAEQDAPAWDWVDRAWLRMALQQVAAGVADTRTRDMALASCSALAFLHWRTVGS